MKNWGGTIEELDYDYWRSTPLINKPWFINPGLTLKIYSIYIPCEPWCWYIYLQNWMILFGQMLVNIPAPWSICVCMYVYAYIYIWINIYVGKYTESIWKMGEYVKPSFLNSIICSFDWINLEQILQGFNLLPRKRRFTNQLKIPVLLQDWPWVCSYFR